MDEADDQKVAKKNFRNVIPECLGHEMNEEKIDQK